MAALVVAALLFAFHVERFYFLNDDSYITFRYASHLAQGLGPVWNPGERVEGYTSPLWMVLMAVSLRVGVPPELSAPALGIASGIAVLVLLWRYCLRSGRSAAEAALVVLLLCANRSFTAWCSGGLETMLFTLLVSAAMLRFAEEHGRDGPAWPSALLVSLAALARPEGALFVAAAGTVVVAQVIRGRLSWRRALAWVAPPALLLGGHEIWRIWYYGELLPNTFYAKVAGVWFAQAARYFLVIHEDYRIGYFLPFAVAAPLLKRRFDVRFFAAVTALYLLYVASVGGDRFEFRFIVQVMPLFALLFVDGLAGTAELLARWLPRRAARAAAAAVSLAFLVVLLIGSHRPEARETRRGVAGIELMRDYADERAEQGRFLRQLVERGILRPDTVLAVGGAGALPYYAQLPTVDCHGLNDHYVARVPIESRGRIGHERVAPLDYLRSRGVVIFDPLNRIVHATSLPRCRGRNCESMFVATPNGLTEEEAIEHVTYDDTVLPLLKVQVDGRYLIFAAVRPVEDVLRYIPGGTVVGR